MTMAAVSLIGLIIVSFMPFTAGFLPSTHSFSRPDAAQEPNGRRPVATDAVKLSTDLSVENLKFLRRPKAPSARKKGVMSSGEAILGLYDAFNARNASAAASFLDDDCIYEDLLLGPNTICRGKEAFSNVIKFHPAFVSSALLGQIPLFANLPALTLVVDSVAEGVDTVGVEWHVEVGTSPFPLGRGLSQATVNPQTGKILRVVDIAEAPWRVIGLLLAPVASVALFLGEFAVLKGGAPGGPPGLS